MVVIVLWCVLLVYQDLKMYWLTGIASCYLSFALYLIRNVGNRRDDSRRENIVQLLSIYNGNPCRVLQMKGCMDSVELNPPKKKKPNLWNSATSHWSHAIYTYLAKLPSEYRCDSVPFFTSWKRKYRTHLDHSEFPSTNLNGRDSSCNVFFWKVRWTDLKTTTNLFLVNHERRKSRGIIFDLTGLNSVRWGTTFYNIWNIGPGYRNYNIDREKNNHHQQILYIFFRVWNFFFHNHTLKNRYPTIMKSIYKT